MNALPQMASSHGEVDLVGAGRDPMHGEYVVLVGENQDPITSLVQSCGLTVDSVTEVTAAAWTRRGVEKIEPDNVWCDVHASYHAPPAH
jgi:hypothetical protein